MKIPADLFGKPPTNLLTIANAPGWMDETLALIGIPRRRLAQARGVAAATLQNYADGRSRMPPDLALWLWEERQWRAARPVPQASAVAGGARTSATIYDERPLSKSKSARAAWDLLAAKGPVKTLRLVNGRWVGMRPSGKIEEASPA